MANTKIIELSRQALWYCCGALVDAEFREYTNPRLQGEDMQMRYEVSIKLMRFLTKYPFTGVQRLKMTELSFLERMILEDEPTDPNELRAAREALGQIQPLLPAIRQA